MIKNDLTVNSFRIIPRDSQFLERKQGQRGEVFYDQDAESLRLYDGTQVGGFSLARADLENISNSVFAAKAEAAGVGGGGGNTSVEVGDIVPNDPISGNLWLNTNNGKLYIYLDDGTSSQWIEPATSAANTTYGVSVETEVNSVNIRLTGSDNTFDDIKFVEGSNITITKTDSSTITVSSTAANNSFANFVVDGQNDVVADQADDTVTFVAGTAVTITTDETAKTITFSAAAETGAVTFVGSTIDTNDSSEITFTPAVRLNSDLSVENNLFVGNKVFAEEFNTTGTEIPELYSASNLYLTAESGAVILTSSPLRLKSYTSSARDSLVTTQIGDMIYNSTTGTFQGHGSLGWADFATSAILNNSTLTGTTNLDGLTTTGVVINKITTLTGATGTVSHMLTTGVTFLHTSIAANFTANFMGALPTNDRIYIVRLILAQGATPFMCNAVQIATVAQTVEWATGVPPSGTANGFDIVTFHLIRSSSTWTVIGESKSYG